MESGDESDTPHTKRKNKFIDDSAPETKSRKRTKRASKRIKFRNELKSLLEILHNHPDQHYEFAAADERELIAQASKWAYEADIDDGCNEFWEWWSKPMHSDLNEIWERKRQADSSFDAVAHINELKEIWEEQYNKAHPREKSFYQFRGWVDYKCRQKGVIMNPQADLNVYADIAQKKLSKNFIITHHDGASIVWEPGPKLWIARDKSRSGVALGELFIKLIDNGDITFSDEKLAVKFRKKISNESVSGVVNWIRGLIPVFPPPVKEQLNRATWMVPVKDGKIIDLNTLKIRTRFNEDLFTVEMNFEWLLDHKKKNFPEEEEGIVMDSKLLGLFKETALGDLQENETHHKLQKLLMELCPNAWRFTRGPLRDAERHWPILLRLGLCLSSYCTRKSLWLYGDGKGLKSTMMSAILQVFGHFGIPLAKKVVFSQGRDDTGHNTDLMRAESKRLLFIDELDKKDILKETQFKLIVSHQHLSCREIYGGQGELKPMGTMVYATNPVPTMEFTDHAIPDRMLPVLVTTRIFNRNEIKCKLPPHFTSADEWEDGYDEEQRFYWVMERLPDLKWSEKFFKGESEGGHAWELGCLLVLAGHIACKMITHPDIGDIPLTAMLEKDKERFFREADHIGQFVDEALEVDTTGKNTSSMVNVWNEYKRWCHEQSMNPVKRKTFVQSLRQKDLVEEKRVKGHGAVQHVKGVLIHNKIT